MRRPKKDITLAQRKQRVKDETVMKHFERVKPDSREQARDVLDLYHKGKFFNHKTPVNLLKRMGSESTTIRKNTRKNIDNNKADWSNLKTVHKKAIELRKNTAARTIQAALQRNSFRKRRIVENK